MVGTSSGLGFYRSDGSLDANPLAGLPVQYSPVITTDGTYVVIGSNIVSLAQDRSMRWIKNMGAAAIGDPRVGPDGTLWVPTSAGMVRTNGSGVLEFLDANVSSPPATSPAVLGVKGEAYWISSGNILRSFWMNRDGGKHLLSYNLGAGVTSASMPAVAPNGNVYIGTNSNTLIKTPTYPFIFADGWTFNVDGAVLHRPATGDDSSVYFATSEGSVYALDASGSLRWRNPLGEPPAAAPSIIIAGGDCRH